MKKYLDQLNQLRPQERRLVVGVALGIFVILNMLFVWPYFGDLGRANAKRDKALGTLARFRAEIGHKREYENRIRILMGTDAPDVPVEDQATHVDRAVQEKALENKVFLAAISPPKTRTNDQFFLEQEVGITAQSTETQMVDFLFSLGSSNSLMRVRAASLHPDPQTHQQLAANMTIVASFQRKPPPARATAPAKAPAATPPAEKTKPAAASTAATPATGAKTVPVGKLTAISNKSSALKLQRP
jgi:hypothetical protein